MGQYWYPVNLDKREFIHPHKLASGLKLWEQLAAHRGGPGVGGALILLCAAMPEQRGGGDLGEDEMISRWAGDRIAMVGDYALDSDVPNSPVPASKIYGLCQNSEYEYDDEDRTDEERADIAKYGLFTDITDKVAAVLEKELDGKFVGKGWRHWKYEQDEEKTGSV